MENILQKIHNLQSRVDDSIKENFGYCSDYTHSLLEELSALELSLKESCPNIYQDYIDKYY